MRMSEKEEERIWSKEREIDNLVSDNQRLAATHVALKQELTSAQHDIIHLSSVAKEVKAEWDGRVTDLHARALHTQIRFREFDALRTDLLQVSTDVKRLRELKAELVAKADAVDMDLVRARSEVQQLPDVEAEIDAMRQHIRKGRAAIEYEKKVHASNLEQSQAMEKDMVTLGQEIEKLRAELANAEKRAIAAAAAAAPANPYPGYASGYVNHAAIYNPSSYTDPYSMHQVQGGQVQGGVAFATPVPQVQGGVAFATPVPHGSYDIKQTHLQR